MSATGGTSAARSRPSRARRRPSPRAAATVDRSRRAGARRRIVAIVVAVALGGGTALGLSQLDRVQETLREVTLPLRHDDIIRQQAGEKQLDPALVAAVIYAESRFRDQTSAAGARGLMQITPQTAQYIARLSGGEQFVLDDLANPDINIRYGSFYLRYLLDRYQGSEVPALAAYHAGETKVDSWGGAALELDDIQFNETRAYVTEVLDKRVAYRESYAKELGVAGRAR